MVAGKQFNACVHVDKNLLTIDQPQNNKSLPF